MNVFANVISLSSIIESDQERVGRKALNLSILANSGFQVPWGFVIPIETYRSFISTSNIENEILIGLKSIDYDNEDSLRSFSIKIRNLIVSSLINSNILKEIDDTLKNHEDAVWAVRSSAMAEDLPEASFAGQQDTYLNLATEDILQHIKSCWASYWNERAIAYRHKAGISHLGHGIALIVQKMVDAKTSGVMFTADPVSGKEEVIIESSWGLGESIVSGLVSPDRFVYDKKTGRPISKKISHKQKGIFYSRTGSSTTDIHKSKKLEPSLTDGEIAALLNLGKKVEKCFGSPQDIEWAIQKSAIYLLQSRPITTISKEKETLWTRAYGDEYWADVTSPLFFTLLGDYLTKYVFQEGYKVMGYWELREKELLKLHKGHIYFNSEVLESVFTYNPKFSRTKELLNYFPQQDQERIANAKTKTLRRIWAEIRIAFLDHDGMITRTAKTYRKWEKTFLLKMRDFDALDLSKLTDEELHLQYKKLEDSFAKHYRLIRHGLVTHSIGTNLIIKRWLIDWLDDKTGVLYSKLICGLPENKTIETNIAIAKLAQAAKEDKEIINYLTEESSDKFLTELNINQDLRDFSTKFMTFLRNYGHRSHTREIYFPRWADDPTLIVDMLKALVTSEELDLEKLEKEKIEERKTTEEMVFKRISKLKYGFLKKPLFKMILKYAQTYLAFRENQRFNLDHTLLRLRRLFLEYGDRLAKRNIIERRDDIFFLTKDEIFLLVKIEQPDIKKKVDERRREFERYSNKLPPKFLKGKIEFDDTTVLQENALKITGTSASPGIATGNVRVVESIKELSKVGIGEILVTSNTDPGWTPVFSKLAGLITETGGILSHGAVVSREYGIPAVTAVENSKQIFKTGQKITIDGNNGVVYILEV